MNELIALWEEVAAVRDTLILTAHAADQHQEALSTIRTIGRVRLVDVFALEHLAPLRETQGGTRHGGEVDTSLLLYLAPDLVDHTAIPPGLPASAEKGTRFYETMLAAVLEGI
jgi:creatinine amidohydrolase/Fe(II)-dependent formamide hydrolase-like protein